MVETTINITWIGRNNGKYDFAVMNTDTIDTLKLHIFNRIHSALDIPLQNIEQDFLLNHRFKKRGGKVFEDDNKTLSFYGIMDGDVLMMSGLGPKGGMAAKQKAESKETRMAELSDGLDLSLLKIDAVNHVSSNTTKTHITIP